ncbi:MAG: hypothetical protein ACR2FM_04005 [Candidatus Saccharimonadales bacterium]
MKEDQLTKQDIRDLLAENTERTIKPLIKQEVRDLLIDHTKNVIRPLIKQELEDHTEQVIKPLISLEVSGAIARSEKKLQDLIEESAQKTIEDLTKVTHTFMDQVDQKFQVLENDIKHINKDYVTLNRKVAYHLNRV